MQEATETGDPATGRGPTRARNGGRHVVAAVPPHPAIWSRVDALVERARSEADLVAHRVHLYAVSRWRAERRPISPELLELERTAAVYRLTAPALLARVRAGYDGVAVLLKGAEVAALYPKPEFRPYVDVDLLVPDAEHVHQVLQRAGFREVHEPGLEEHHHLQPLEWPGLPMLLEIHSDPSWPGWLTSPPVGELFESATKECALGAGVLALARPQHTLLLVAHAWREAPLARLGHLLDIAVTCEGEDPAELMSLAHAWSIDRLWRRTTSAIGHVLGDDDAGFATGALTRHFGPMRDRTVLETKLAEWMAPFCGLPPARALRAATGEIATELRPEHDETWSRKLTRTRRALRQSFRPRSERDQALLEEARDRMRRRVPPVP